MHEMERCVADTSDAQAAAKMHDAKNFAFHYRIVELAGNRRLLAMYDDLRAHLRIARAHLDADTWLGRVPAEAAEHLAIVEALAARDVEAMQRALDAHLRRSSESLIEDVSRPEGRDAGRAVD
jgi:DNA-binding GntR family transcriptional regulator